MSTLEIFLGVFSATATVMIVIIEKGWAKTERENNEMRKEIETMIRSIRQSDTVARESKFVKMFP